MSIATRASSTTLDKFALGCWRYGANNASSHKAILRPTRLLAAGHGSNSTSTGLFGTTANSTSLSPATRFSNTLRMFHTGAYLDNKRTVSVPSMGESITEGRLMEWLKKEGDSVETDEKIIQIETEKIRVDINSPCNGVIEKLLAKEGDDVRVGQELFVVVEGPKKAETKETKETQATQQKDTQATQQKDTQAKATQDTKKETPKEAPKKESKPPQDQKTQPKTSAPDVNVKPTSREEKVVKMTKLRERIAQRLKESQNTAAMLTTFNEIDMHNLIELRNKYKEEFQKKHGVKLGFMSCFVKAASAALREYPIVNAYIKGDSIVYRDYHDVSVAVATPNGLLVPVIRDVQNLSFAQVEKVIAHLSQKGKDGTIAREDMDGGSFTVSNGGVYGSLFGTPIINPPQSAILGMHAINEKPHVVNGQITVRPIMMVALTYDHRLIDGREAVLFLRKIKECVEDPNSMLLEI